MFQQYRMNSDQYVRHMEWLQQLFTHRFVDFSKDRGLFRTSANPSEALYEDAEHINSLN